MLRYIQTLSFVKNNWVTVLRVLVVTSIRILSTTADEIPQSEMMRDSNMTDSNSNHLDLTEHQTSWNSYEPTSRGERIFQNIRLQEFMKELLEFNVENHVRHSAEVYQNEKILLGRDPRRLENLFGNIKTVSKRDTSYELRKKPTRFLSRSKSYKAYKGGSLVLPCKVENLNSYVVIWRQGSRVLTAGTLIVRKDRRLKLQEDSYNLVIDDIKSDDEGVYTCEIEAGQHLHTSKLKQQGFHSSARFNDINENGTSTAETAKEEFSTFSPKILRVTHKLEVLVHPTIRPMPSDGKIVSTEGENVILRCSAHGKPNPKITWSKKITNHSKRSRNKSGLKEEMHFLSEGLSLELKRADRGHAGLYQCTATNGVGPSVSAFIEVDILYAAEIRIKRFWYFQTKSSVNHKSSTAVRQSEQQTDVLGNVSQEGGRHHTTLNAKLVCIVNSNPKSKILWYRNDRKIHETDKFFFINGGGDDEDVGYRFGQPQESVLHVKDVDVETDFGNYSCKADNQIGKHSQPFLLNGNPSPPKIVSDSVVSSDESSYHGLNLTWVTDSIEPLLQFEAMFKSQNFAMVDKKIGRNENDCSGKKSSIRCESDGILLNITETDRWASSSTVMRQNRWMFLKIEPRITENFHPVNGSEHNYLRDEGSSWGRDSNSPKRMSRLEIIQKEAAVKVYRRSSHRERVLSHTNCHIFQHLKTNTVYDFRLRARNKFGWSEWSDVFSSSFSDNNGGILVSSNRRERWSPESMDRMYDDDSHNGHFSRRPIDTDFSTDSMATHRRRSLQKTRFPPSDIQTISAVSFDASNNNSSNRLKRAEMQNVAEIVVIIFCSFLSAAFSSFP